MKNFQSFKNTFCEGERQEITPILRNSPSLNSFYGESTKRGIEQDLISHRDLGITKNTVISNDEVSL